MKKYFKLMRVHHYIKNILVFAALACSGQFLNYKKLTAAVMGFLSFCMISSVIYIINDIRDKEKDKQHPEKCKRPIASGNISVKAAIAVAVILFCISAICNLFVFDLLATLLLFLYFILNVSYSFGLKNIPILDVTILVSGFLIRMLYGAFVTDISVSKWMYLTVAVLSFYFAFGKRRNESIQSESTGNTRTVLKYYPITFLDKYMTMCLSLSNVFYALWCMDDKTISLYNSNYLILTVPIVLLITMKYGLNIENNSNGDPVEVLLHDKILLILCVMYLALMLTILYIL